MLIGEITGRVKIDSFKFAVKKKLQRLDYVTVKSKQGNWVLCQVTDIYKTKKKTKAKAVVIGYRDDKGLLKSLRSPFESGSLVYKADKGLISQVLDLEKEQGLYLGLLEGHSDISVFIDPEKMLSKHLAVLAKSGSGKSYLVGVILEELLEKNIPFVVLDPHGEYSTFTQKNDAPKEVREMDKYGVKPKSYKVSLRAVDTEINPGTEPIRLNPKLVANEVIQMLPMSMSGAQLGVLYTALKNLKGRKYTIDDVAAEVEAIDSNAKWNVISLLELLQDTGLFSDNYTEMGELVKRNQGTIINLRGVAPEMQEIAAYKLCKQLFEARKRNEIPPFFLVLEEAHNFAPERGFGEAVSSKVIRNISSEGRKFGLGLLVVSQRPARLDKSVLSQCSTQAILKITNSHDLKAISSSAEGLTKGMNKEIQNLQIGTALLVGGTEQPVFVDVRTRRSKHGGGKVDISSGGKSKKTKTKKSSPKKTSARVFMPKLTEEELKKKLKEKIKRKKLLYYPLWSLKCKYKDSDYKGTVNLLLDGVIGELLSQRKGKILRSQGVRKILHLSPSQRLVLLYLALIDAAPKATLSQKLDISPTAVDDSIGYLEKEGLIEKKGDSYQSTVAFKNIPPKPYQAQVSEEPIRKSVDGLPFVVPAKDARKVIELWSSIEKTISMDQVYYPYWLVEYTEGMKIIIDGMTGDRDQFIEKVIERIK